MIYKPCNRCKIQKPLSEFQKNGYYDKGELQGQQRYKSYCKQCGIHGLKRKDLVVVLGDILK